MLRGQSQQGSVWVCEPMLWHIPEGREQERSWASPPNSSRALGRSNGRDWLFQVRTGPGVARAQTKATARDWATKCLHLEHGLHRNLPQAAVSKGLWVNPLDAKNLRDVFALLLTVKPCWMWHLFTGGRWGWGGGGEYGGQYSWLRTVLNLISSSGSSSFEYLWWTAEQRSVQKWPVALPGAQKGRRRGKKATDITRGMFSVAPAQIVCREICWHVGILALPQPRILLAGSTWLFWAVGTAVVHLSEHLAPYPSTPWHCHLSAGPMCVSLP